MILGPRGPRILKFWGPGGPKIGGPHFHMTPGFSTSAKPIASKPKDSGLCNQTLSLACLVGGVWARDYALSDPYVCPLDVAHVMNAPRPAVLPRFRRISASLYSCLEASLIGLSELLRGSVNNFLLHCKYETLGGDCGWCTGTRQHYPAVERILRRRASVSKNSVGIALFYHTLRTV